MKKKLKKEGIINNKELLEFFKREEYIRLVYLFGSYAKGKEGKLSDLDFAILLNKSMTKHERFNIQLKLIGKISEILAINNLDLIILNDVSLTLKYEVIKANTPIFIRNITEKVDFEHEILSKYLDRRYYEKRAASEFLKQVAEKGL